MIKHIFTRQFLGFLAVGGFAALLHWLSRIILSNWLSFSAAIVFAYIIGMIVAFTLNSIFVFPKSKKSKYRQAIDFILVNLAFLPVVWLASIVLEPIFRSFGMVLYSQAAAHGVAVAIPTFVTFLAYKFFAFNDVEYGRK